jgi:subtilisin-like proprotein convertase family protein
MKKSNLIWILTAGLFGGAASNAPAISIPDGDPSGVSDTIILTSSITSITAVSVNLDLSAGFNGDLYVYLRHGGALAVLLNRTGRTDTDASGYADSGFAVVLADATGRDIHNYQSVQAPVPGSKLTGVWAPDARAADPDSVTETSGRSAYLSVFNGMPAAGEWTLFLADLSTGDASVLNHWSLRIEGNQPGAVPDSHQGMIPLQFALAGFLCLLHRRYRLEIPRRRHQGGAEQ